MSDLRLFKIQARKMLRRNYAILVIACLIGALLGSDYSSSLIQNSIKTITDYSTSVVETGTTSVGLPDIGDAFEELFHFNPKDEIKVDEKGNLSSIGDLEFGRRKGIFSSLANTMVGKDFFVILFETVSSIIQSKSIGTDIIIVLAAMIILSVSFFARYTYSVSFRRIYLESYLYDTTKASRFLFLYKVKRIFKASRTIFLTAVLQFLWNLTLIGGVVAYYNFMMVPYIVAENPDIEFNEAIRLSRRMVYGHRLELFMMQFSFILWYIIGRLTLGISDIIFTNPYMECTKVQYYFKLRQLAKENAISYADKLNDTYLSVKPSYELVEKTYEDVVEVMTNDLDVRNLRNDGYRGFIENNLGIIYRYDAKEDKYNAAMEEEEKIDDYHRILDLEQYPARLCPLNEKNSSRRMETLHYLRHYSIWSIIALFFIFSFVGWMWEVMLHVVKDGQFVNRGVMHGPWLPIYGSGACIILMLLFKYRGKPLLEASLTILLCGILEYFTSWYLEVSKGLKWWDYSGYFININGRICAEGLTVFMIGGIVAVYFLAPIIDNLLHRINQNLLKVICIILLIVFSIDTVYSQNHPNTGKGITDYDNVSYNIQYRNKK